MGSIKDGVLCLIIIFILTRLFGASTGDAFVYSMWAFGIGFIFNLVVVSIGMGVHKKKINTK